MRSLDTFFFLSSSELVFCLLELAFFSRFCKVTIPSRRLERVFLSELFSRRKGRQNGVSNSCVNLEGYFVSRTIESRERSKDDLGKWIWCAFHVHNVAAFLLPSLSGSLKFYFHRVLCMQNYRFNSVTVFEIYFPAVKMNDCKNKRLTNKRLKTRDWENRVKT